MKEFIVRVPKDSRVSEYLLNRMLINLISKEDDIDPMDTYFEVIPYYLGGSPDEE
ncbi:hypothetical protein [Bacillus toyonensis]|uniref:hypothetical protein n=1 Tax=Bacillus toyonensis TaxID=155322 RepID=UPI00178C1E56|nr:hypothetical protein [Bacillus toyonensis]